MTPAAETSNVASTLIDALIASNRGDRHAFAFGAKRYSYQDVAALMNRAGNMLKAIEIPSGAKVLLLLPGSPALVASLLGAMKAGAVPIVGAPVDDTAALERCVIAAQPAAAIVHQSVLGSAEAALSSLPADSIIVVGNDVQGHKSFVEAIRGQSSWLSATPLDSNAPALAIWSGTSLRIVSHGELAALVEGQGNGLDGESARVLAMLRSFSNGDEAELP